MSRRRFWASLASAALCATIWPRNALGDGAFPAGLSVFVPPHRPNAIVVAANFGLVQSEDQGQTWTYACEDPERTRDGRFYGFTEEPGIGERIFTIGLQGLAVTDDTGCTWTTTAAATDDVMATDYFIDPSNPRRLAILADLYAPGGQPSSVLYISDDGGKTLGPPHPSAGAFKSVEIAASDSRVIYAVEAMAGADSRLLRSDDGGGTWTSSLLPATQGLAFKIITIDPREPRKVFLRATNFASDRILLTTDGGGTFTTVFDRDAETVVTAFLLRQDGTVLIGVRDGMGMGSGYRSSDGGLTFLPWDTHGLHLRGLVEKERRLYALAENALDPFALAVSDDEGAHWQPILAYAQISAVKPCTRARCVADCMNYADLGLFPLATCGAPAVDGAADGGPREDPPGCGCLLGAHGGPAWLRDRLAVGFFLMVAAALLARRRRLRQRMRR